MEARSSADLPEPLFFTARKARVRSNPLDASSSSQPPSPLSSLSDASIFSHRKVDCEMEVSSTTDLPESFFFTARKARGRSINLDASSSSEPASSSREYYSPRMHSIMERKSKLNMSQEDAEIEASKDHWTVVEPDYFTSSTRRGTDSSTSGSVSVSCPEALTESERMTLYEENLKEMRRLQEANPESQFFRVGDDGIVLGKKIAEGGQAEIYEVQGTQSIGLVRHLLENGIPLVLKVFKAGYSVRDLQRQWPLALLHKSCPTNGSRDDFGFFQIVCGRLLGDGRFAFQMFRLWGDLRKLLDERMEHNGNRHAPFMMPDGEYNECCMLHIIFRIVEGMRGLHREGTLHRDLKASNVLIMNDGVPVEEFHPGPMQVKHGIWCAVTDYECSIGIVGTGYWRAPEILEALKNRRVGTTPNLFTPKSDVCSFAMTCYEVLTGWIPFEEVEDCNEEALVNDVLRGRRPKLPNDLQPWLVELMNKCWHVDPFKRPTFDEIFYLLQIKSTLYFEDHYEEE